MQGSVDHHMTEIYCFIDEFLKTHPGLAQWRPSPHPQHFVGAHYRFEFSVTKPKCMRLAQSPPSAQAPGSGYKEG